MRSEPVSLNERIVSLDIIRGFALFGILLVNMPTFHSPELVAQLYSMPQHYTGIDRWIRLFFDLFVQAKFYPIFSFLFGVGFFLFLSRAERKGHRVYVLMCRRLLALLLFGMLHLVLLWYGDILHAYAITGFILLLFYRQENNTILVWAFVLLVLYFGLLSLQFLIPSAAMGQIMIEQQSIGQSKVREAIEVYRNATYRQWVSYRVHNEVGDILSGLPFLIPVILSMFLFGFYAGRKRIFSHFEESEWMIRRVWATSFLLGLPLVFVLLLLEISWLDAGSYQYILKQFLVQLSGIVLSFFYMAAFLLLLQKKKWETLLRPLGYMGRMAFTNYLFQTCLSLAVIFGFGLFARMSLAAGSVLCLIIYVFQMVFSYYWLKYYRFGPLEWIWRTMTYGHAPPLRKQTASIRRGEKSEE
ncbi:DUF418 domain-containing protein [Aneurinibacillus tyrosinisolvens]|uniref:DUF418 domain-containing protein n=1 Tax=Aneurinibacillus tyrosinisolvens TaxID=1443435 RepID=UPI00063EE075|nr:DUF418 domain-containing protein [Aneurinibacillus tyrosinisolvens]